MPPGKVAAVASGLVSLLPTVSSAPRKDFPMNVDDAVEGARFEAGEFCC
jgi:hypothetical protein